MNALNTKPADRMAELGEAWKEVDMMVLLVGLDGTAICRDRTHCPTGGRRPRTLCDELQKFGAEAALAFPKSAQIGLLGHVSGRRH
jgi:hypothetical protein